MAKALARAKAVAGVEVSTTGYSSYQFTEKNQPHALARVADDERSKARDFASMAALVTRLQADDQLVMSGMNFAREPRRAPQGGGRAHAAGDQGVAGARAERRARLRLRALAHRQGHASRPATTRPPRPMFRAAAPMAAAAAPPVSVEGGNTDVTVYGVGRGGARARQRRLLPGTRRRAHARSLTGCAGCRCAPPVARPGADEQRELRRRQRAG